VTTHPGPVEVLSVGRGPVAFRTRIADDEIHTAPEDAQSSPIATMVETGQGPEPWPLGSSRSANGGSHGHGSFRSRGSPGCAIGPRHGESGKRRRAMAAGSARRAVHKRCASQRGQCLAGVTKTCAPTIDPAVCEASLAPCCDHFARYDAETGVGCLFTSE
jgi:hypothetical protein